MRIVSGPVAWTTRRCSSSRRRATSGASGQVEADHQAERRAARGRASRRPGARAARRARGPRRGSRARRSRRAPRSRPRRSPGRRRRSSRGRRARARRRRPGSVTQAPTGSPPPRPLATVMTSGRHAELLDAPRACRCGPCRTGSRRRSGARRARRRPRARRASTLRVERVDAGLALDRLEQDRRGVVASPPRGERAGVVARHDLEARARAARTAPASPPAASPRARPSCGRGSRPPSPRSRRPAGACARASARTRSPRRRSCRGTRVPPSESSASRFASRIPGSV